MLTTTMMMMMMMMAVDAVCGLERLRPWLNGCSHVHPVRSVLVLFASVTALLLSGPFTPFTG
jgi:hypothetical protein